MVNMPKILRRKRVAKGKVFSINAVEIMFPNGKKVKHEYMDSATGNGRKSAVIVPVDKNGKILLIELYCTGVNKREVMCPTGLVDKGETALQAAKRECQEEIGYLPKKLVHLGTVETAPGYSTHSTEIYLGTNLVPSKLQGDEPEELKVIRTSFKDIPALIKKCKLQYATSIAALLMAEKYLEKHKT